MRNSEASWMIATGREGMGCNQVLMGSEANPYGHVAAEHATSIQLASDLPPAHRPTGSSRASGPPGRGIARPGTLGSRQKTGRAGEAMPVPHTIKKVEAGPDRPAALLMGARAACCTRTG